MSLLSHSPSAPTLSAPPSFATDMAELPPLPPPRNNGAQAGAREPKPKAPIAPSPIWPPRPNHPYQQCPQGRPFYPLVRPLLPPPPRGRGWVSPPRPPMAPFAIVYGPYGFLGIGPYGYQWFRPIGPPQPPVPLGLPLPQPQPQFLPCLRTRPRPQPQANGNRARVDAQRRGTGVFIPSPRPQPPVSKMNSNNTSSRGRRNKQGAEASTRQIWRPKNRNTFNGNDGVMKQDNAHVSIQELASTELEEGHQKTPSPEMGLPKEWTY